MANSKQLSENKNQHTPKNQQSKESDKAILQAMEKTIDYLKDRFKDDLENCQLIHKREITYNDIISIIKSKDIRKEFDNVFPNRAIKPDGGIIYLERKNFKKVVLISEVKKQGTNKERQAAGKKKQAQGNAIERLGKNLIGIKAMLTHEFITPFVCFGWGCDFKEDYKNDFVMAKISMLNEFYKLNKTYVYKRDGDSSHNHFAPVSMYFRENKWSEDDMFKILKEVAEDSIRYYLH